jgi:hypothetical protein
VRAPRSSTEARVPSSTWEHFEVDAGDRADVLTEEHPSRLCTLRAASLSLIGAARYPARSALGRCSNRRPFGLMADDSEVRPFIDCIQPVLTTDPSPDISCASLWHESVVASCGGHLAGQCDADYLSAARSDYGHPACSALSTERLISNAALARSTAKSSPAVYSAASTPPLNPVMSQTAAIPSDVPPRTLKRRVEHRPVNPLCEGRLRQRRVLPGAGGEIGS